MRLSKNEIDHINKEIEARQDLADTAARQATDTFRTFSGQLVIVCGMVLSFSSALSVSQYAANLGHNSRRVLACAWFSLALSIAFGFISHFKDAAFFVDWQIYHTKVGKELATGKSNTINNVVKKFEDIKPKTQSPMWPLWCQVGFLAVGSGLFFAVILHSFLR